jgi:hypothetical protein
MMFIHKEDFHTETSCGTKLSDGSFWILEHLKNFCDTLMGKNKKSGWAYRGYHIFDATKVEQTIQTAARNVGPDDVFIDPDWGLCHDRIDDGGFACFMVEKKDKEVNLKPGTIVTVKTSRIQDDGKHRAVGYFNYNILCASLVARSICFGYNKSDEHSALSDCMFELLRGVICDDHPFKAEYEAAFSKAHCLAMSRDPKTRAEAAEIFGDHAVKVYCDHVAMM